MERVAQIKPIFNLEDEVRARLLTPLTCNIGEPFK